MESQQTVEKYQQDLLNTNFILDGKLESLPSMKYIVFKNNQTITSQMSAGEIYISVTNSVVETLLLL